MLHFKINIVPLSKSDQMTIKEAIKKLMDSDKFQEDAKTDAKLRVFKQRYNSGMIGPGAAINLLTSYGYKVEVMEKKLAKS